MNKKGILYLVFVLFLIFSESEVLAQKKPKSKKEFTVKKMELVYNSSNKEIEIKDDTLFITTYKEVYDSPMSSVPSSRVPEVSKRKFESKEKQALIQLIRSSGFFALAQSEYGVSKEERFYPYRIKVKLDSSVKDVLYRSNPSGEKAPEAFDKIESYLNQLK